MREFQWLGSLTQLSSGFRLEVAWNEGDGQALRTAGRCCNRAFRARPRFGIQLVLGEYTSLRSGPALLLGCWVPICVILCLHGVGHSHTMLVAAVPQHASLDADDSHLLRSQFDRKGAWTSCNIDVASVKQRKEFKRIKEQCCCICKTKKRKEK